MRPAGVPEDVRPLNDRASSVERSAGCILVRRRNFCPSGGRESYVFAQSIFEVLMGAVEFQALAGTLQIQADE
jgi:hypothetical protein